MFKITLHKDDERVLRIIKDRLGIGGVRIYKDECIFTITKQKEIAILISIFDTFNLNTSKYLDYLDFKEGFFLFKNRKSNELSIQQIYLNILELKQNMNFNRVNFVLPANHNIRITGNYLVGF